MENIQSINKPSSGKIILEGNEMKDLTRKEIAKKLGLLTQDSDDVFPSTVFDSVLIGRHPHIGIFNNESNEDLQIAKKALDADGDRWKTMDNGSLELDRLEIGRAHV